MEFLVDTASLAEIREAVSYLPVAGVTTNPTILSREQQISFYNHLHAIRELIGPGRPLHVQAVSDRWEELCNEGKTIAAAFGPDVYVKVPATREGLRAIRALKDAGIGVTATAVYSEMQGLLAARAGADYIAPYWNRMENLGVDAAAVVSSCARLLRGGQTKILAASFKNTAQVVRALEAGADAVTVAPALFWSALDAAPVADAVAAFTRDWRRGFGTGSVCELPE